jgi:hypothetical protein
MSLVRSRRSRRLAVSLLSCLIVAGASIAPVGAQGSAAPTPVTIDAVGPDGISGLALLMPAQNGSTNIQILVAGASSGTFAVIHGGTCAAIDPAPVALLGDVSATSQVAAANPFESLTDGQHVLVLHLGLDLTQAVGCGAIPAVAATVTPPPAQTDAPVAQGGTYTAPDSGFTIAWPAGWEQYDVVAAEGEERIGLRKPPSSILMSGRVQQAADAQACVRDARQGLFDRLDAGSLRDLAPIVGDDGSPVAGTGATQAWIAYRYVSIEEGGQFPVADYFECRVSNDVVVFILHRSLPDTYAQEAAERDALLAGLTLPTDPAGPPSGPPGPTAVPGGGSYAAPTLGFSLTWDGRWMESPIVGLDGYEHVGLSDGPSRVAVSGILDPTWDALACAQDSDADFQVRASDGRVSDLEPLLNADGSRVRGGDATRAWVAYRYTDAETGAAVAEYHECRAANTVVVRIQHRSLPEVYAQEAVARDELLAGLTMPATAPPAPAATPDPGCSGYQAWHDATTARFDKLTQLKAEADEAAAAYDLPRYVGVLVRSARDLQRMKGEQEQEPAPPLAQDANALAAKTFAGFASAAKILAEYYQSSTNTATLQRAARAQDAAERVEADFNVALADIEAACE